MTVMMVVVMMVPMAPDHDGVVMMVVHLCDLHLRLG